MGRAPKTKPSGYHNLLANFPHSAQSLSTAQLFASWWVRSNCKGIQPAANWHSFTCGWSPPSFVQSHFLQLSLQIPGSNSTVKSQSPNRRQKKNTGSVSPFSSSVTAGGILWSVAYHLTWCQLHVVYHLLAGTNIRTEVTEKRNVFFLDCLNLQDS